MVKRGQKWREVYSIIMYRIRAQGSILPENIELPVLHFNVPNKESDVEYMDYSDMDSDMEVEDNEEDKDEEDGEEYDGKQYYVEVVDEED